jgi:protein-S-isoprenylcysteine O-methyltransferase Ste14
MGRLTELIEKSTNELQTPEYLQLKPLFVRKNTENPGTMNDTPNVRIIPPLVYLAGLVIGVAPTIWFPTNVVPGPVAWIIGAILILCGAVLSASAIFNFKAVGTTVRPDRAATTLVTVGPYKLTRNPMYLALALIYLGISIAAQSLWALLLLPVVLTIIVNRAIKPEEAFLERRFGTDYLRYKANVRRWL